MTDRAFVARAAGIWLSLAAAESIHGVMRRLFLEPPLGDLHARQVSVVTGALLIAVVFWFTLGWLRPQPARRWWTLGLLWLAATLAFEIGVGRLVGLSWDRIASDFDPRRGGFLAFGMLVILVAPRLVAQRRGYVGTPGGDAEQGPIPTTLMPEGAASSVAPLTSVSRNRRCPPRRRSRRRAVVTPPNPPPSTTTRTIWILRVRPTRSSRRAQRWSS